MLVLLNNMVVSSKPFSSELQLKHWIIQRNSSNIESKLPLILSFSALILVKLGLQQLLLNFATSNIELAQIMWEYQISGPQEEKEPAKGQEREGELLKYILKWFLSTNLNIDNSLSNRKVATYTSLIGEIPQTSGKQGSKWLPHNDTNTPHVCSCLNRRSSPFIQKRICRGFFFSKYVPHTPDSKLNLTSILLAAFSRWTCSYCELAGNF